MFQCQDIFQSDIIVYVDHGNNVYMSNDLVEKHCYHFVDKQCCFPRSVLNNSLLFTPCYNEYGVNK